MEWVIITAKTLPEAIDLALSNLGVDEAEAEIEELEVPKQGLFGRTKGVAKVRARVKPKETRPKEGRNRNRRRRSGGGDGGGRGGQGRNRNGNSGDGRRSKGEQSQKKSRDGGQQKTRGGNAERSSENNGGGRKQKQSEEPAKEASVEEVAAHVETFLSGLVEAIGVDGAVRIDSDGEDGIIGVVEGQHGLLVGPKGRTLDAVQELTRVTAQRTVPSNVRIKVDVGGYRQMRAEALQRFALKVAEEAQADGKERALEPMNSADRKIVHDALNGVDGVETRSAGTDPRRRVVVVPIGGSDEADDEPLDDEVAADEVEEAVESAEVEQTDDADEAAEAVVD